MPDGTPKAASSCSPAQGGVFALLLRSCLSAARARLRAIGRRWVYRPERRYLRGAAPPHMLAALLVLGGTWHAMSDPVQGVARLRDVVALADHVVRVLSDSPRALPPVAASATHPCEITLRLDSGAILPVFLTVDGARKAAYRADKACAEDKARARPVRHRPEARPGAAVLFV
jgi:hypothetical protein